MKIHNFKELKVWQKSMDLTILVYELITHFPKEERFGLISQIQRAAVSIPSNIAEGSGRVSEKEFQHFISISMGSSLELETQMLLAFKFGYLSEDKIRAFQELNSEVQKMLYGLYKSLNRF